MDVYVFADTYKQLTKHTLDLIDSIYHRDIVFEDPAHRVVGLEALQHYFEMLFRNIDTCHFEIDDSYQIGNSGFVTWVMHFSHPKINRGRPIQVDGISRIRFQDDLVIFHRDYFDLGQMIYEHLPLFGFLIRKIKMRLRQ
jgi:ketosteroid isomerase-like protein